MDGVVIVPQQITSEVVEKALQKVREENQVRGMLENGVSLAKAFEEHGICLLYTSPSPRDGLLSRMPSSA